MGRIIYALLEGPDDIRFFNSAIKDKLLKKYSTVKTQDFAGMPKNEFQKFIRSIQAKGNDYIIFSDMDDATCYTKRKVSFQKRWNINVAPARIVVVKAEIESWYLAGLGYSATRSLNINFRTNTENVTKEMFLDMTRKHHSSNINLMIEILKEFSFDTAKRQNASFQYFCNKFNLKTNQVYIGEKGSISDGQI